jgi:very-short-patch-repair endonuclease
VFRSETLDGETASRAGIVVTTAERTLLDLAAHLRARAIARAFREALRLRHTTCERMLGYLGPRAGRRGTVVLRDLAGRYAGVPLHRTRSDAEARALELLHDNGLDPPRVNVKVAGAEADLVWPGRRLIIEVDGPQYHRFRDEDAQKEGRWRGAGYAVRRISSDAIYADPSRLIALVASGGASAS